MPRIGILTGLNREAACLAPLRDAPEPPLVRLSAARAERARAMADELAAAGVAGLASFGFAGGLDPGLEPGTLVLPEAVVDRDGGHWAADAGWRAALAFERSTTALAGPVAGVDAVVADAPAKSALRAETGGAICDMESHHVARAAAAAGLPFVVVRAVVDAADTAVPGWTLAMVGEAGEGKWTKLTKSTLAALSHPGDWPTLVRLGRASGEACRELRRLVAGAGPFLGLPRL